LLHEEWYEEFEEEEQVQPRHYGPGPFRRQCAFCRGTGVHPGSMMSINHDRCPLCEGTGLLDFKGHERDYNPCGRCDGSGIDPDVSPVKPCPTCGGRGLI
jgi:DnaJ-class molecular chaperone